MKKLFADMLFLLGFKSKAGKLYKNPQSDADLFESIYKSPIFKFVLILTIVLLVMNECFKSNRADSDYEANSPKGRIEKHFSKYDGSCISFKSFIKENLKDPSSFEHVETRYNDNNDGTVIVYMKYRAKNSFGAIVTEIAKCTLNTSSGEFSNVVTE